MKGLGKEAGSCHVPSCAQCLPHASAHCPSRLVDAKGQVDVDARRHIIYVYHSPGGAVLTWYAFCSSCGWRQVNSSHSTCSERHRQEREDRH